MTEPTTPRTALPDPANDEMLTMSGYEWWRYRRAIEAEVRAAALDEAREAVDAALTKWMTQSTEYPSLDEVLSAAIDALRAKP